jgi:hypothetical protein
MKQVASVSSSVSFGESHRSVGCAALGIDLGSVSSAPFDEFVGVYNDLLNQCSLLLQLFNSRFHSFEPMIVIGLEIGIDGQPSRPIFFAHPGDRHSN